MLKVLIIKTSSLGDVVHMLPALKDAVRCIDAVCFDWVVEEGFQEVPAWSPYVDKVIPVAIRRWRKSLLSSKTRQEISAFKQILQSEKYDIVVDSQGLLKSAILTRWAKSGDGVWGYDKHSIREPLACYFYKNTATVSREIHAITRNRQLLSKALGYSLDGVNLDYGLQTEQFPPSQLSVDKYYIVALHGTSKIDKEWPIESWKELVKAMAEENIKVLFPWGNQREKDRVDLLSDHSENAHALPKCSLFELACLISNSRAVIGMDTGLMHIAAGLNKKGIGLYPVTQPVLTGVLTGGKRNLIENISGKETDDVKSIITKMNNLLDSL